MPSVEMDAIGGIYNPAPRDDAAPQRGEALRQRGSVAGPPVNALPTLDPEDPATVVRALAIRRDALRQQAVSQGWPSWNLTREQARSALERARLP